MTRQSVTRVILAAAHLDHDPRNRRQRNLRSLCQRCHLTHDRAWHLLQRWITYRLGDVPMAVEIGEAGVTELRAYAATAVGSRAG
jgi:hypothetical protein